MPPLKKHKVVSLLYAIPLTLTLNDSIQSSIEKIKGSEVELTEDLPNFYC